MWTKEQIREYNKIWRAKNKDKCKAYRDAHKEQIKEWEITHREQKRANKKKWDEAHKEYNKICDQKCKAKDTNSFGETKALIRSRSRWYLIKYGTIIPNYEIHHCCTYDDAYKFIYCSKETHKMIHAYLRQHNIDADNDHYQYIKHLLDDTVIKYNIE